MAPRSIQFTNNEDDGEGPFYLCHALLWGHFMGWVNSLPLDRSAGLRQLVTNGEAKDTANLRRELKRALVKDRPDDDCVNAVAKVILDRIGVGDREESALIVDD
jgi:hypothetical protein